MKEKCKITGYIIGVLGVIGSIILSVTNGVSMEYTIYGLETTRNVGLTIGILVGGILSTLSIAFILIGISEVLEWEEYISAEIEKMKKESEINRKTELEENGKSWVCDSCGKYNPRYVSICSCGKSRNEQ